MFFVIFVVDNKTRNDSGGQPADDGYLQKQQDDSNQDAAFEHNGEKGQKQSEDIKHGVPIFKLKKNGRRMSPVFI
jgi:hypothetical protein